MACRSITTSVASPPPYERILKNMADRRLNIHWTVTRPMLARAGYIGEYVAFLNARPEVDRIWVSLYSPQVDECSVEMLTAEDRRNLLDHLVRGSMAAGSIVNRWQTKAPPPSRWDRGSRVQEQEPALVEISGD